MAGPNGERCGDCQCWSYQRDIMGVCRARAPVGIALSVADSQNCTVVLPMMEKDDWCVHDFLKCRNPES